MRLGGVPIKICRAVYFGYSSKNIKIERYVVSSCITLVQVAVVNLWSCCNRNARLAPLIYLKGFNTLPSLLSIRTLTSSITLYFHFDFSDFRCQTRTRLRVESKDVIAVFCDHRFVQLFQVLSLDYHIELIVENRIVLDLQTGVVHFSESTPIKGFHATSIPFQDFISCFPGLSVNEF